MCWDGVNPRKGEVMSSIVEPSGLPVSAATLSATVLLVLAASTPATGAQPRKCPADEIVVAGHSIAKILAILGAHGEDGATVEELRAYARAFDGTDRDGDRRHSKKEYIENGRHMNPRARRGIFGAADNDADGFVTRVEYVLNRAITDEAKGIVQRTDADKNGKVTREEFVNGSPIGDRALGEAVYDALDTSGDGVITIPEYLRVWGGWARPNYKEQEAKLARRLEHLGKGSDGTSGSKPGRVGPPSVEQIFKVMDRNKDGKLTKAEFRGPAHVFTSADKDVDGEVTRAEMEAFRARTGGAGKRPAD